MWAMLLWMSQFYGGFSASVMQKINWILLETAHQHKLFLECQEQAYKNVISKHDSRIPCHFTIHTSVLQVFVVHWQLQKQAFAACWKETWAQMMEILRYQAVSNLMFYTQSAHMVILGWKGTKQIYRAEVHSDHAGSQVYKSSGLVARN